MPTPPSSTPGPPAVSVALCTYNGARFLAEQLRSIRDQSLPPAQVVVSDDGSTDATPEIVAEFAREAPFEVRFVRQPVNLGVARNFAAALALCRGEMIALCDQDDVWLPDKLRVCADFLGEHPDCWAVFTDAVVTDERLQPHPQAPSLREHVHLSDEVQRAIADPATSLRALTDSNYVTGATVLVRPELLRYALPIPEVLTPTMIHDGWLGVVAAALGRLGYLDRPTILYRQHAGQQAGLIQPPPPPRPLGLPRRIFATLADNCETLHAALAARVAPAAVPGVLEEVRDRAAHFRARANLPRARRHRPGPILGEWKRGGYRRFSRRPLLAAVRDALF